MKFSVLIPVYNTEQYLDECINSILSQSFKDFEIIIVNDGSTDNSGKLCDKYKNNYPNQITVIHQENQGLISARRVAINCAKGEYCVFVDSDDFVEPILLENVNQCLCQISDIDIVMYSYYYFSDGKRKEHSKIANNGMIWDSSNKAELYKKLVFSSEIDAIWIKAIKTDLLLKDPIPYEKYKHKNMSEDLLQSLYPITFAEKIYYLDNPLYDYRYNNQSISRCFNKDTISAKNSLYVYHEIKQLLPLWAIDEDDFIKHINARWFNETMYNFFNSYENTKTKKDRKEILNFNWDSMLPNNILTSFSKYANNDYCKVYDWWKLREQKNINNYFIRRKLYKRIKQIKKKIKN